MEIFSLFWHYFQPRRLQHGGSVVDGPHSKKRPAQPGGGERTKIALRPRRTAVQNIDRRLDDDVERVEPHSHRQHGGDCAVEGEGSHDWGHTLGRGVVVGGGSG